MNSIRKKDRLWEEILSMPVWDTHTHLDESLHISAQNFFDIVHYFWFKRELQAAGYPANTDILTEEERIEVFIKAFNATRNTYWNWTVRRIFIDLYNVEITDAKSIKEANEKIYDLADHNLNTRSRSSV